MHNAKDIFANNVDALLAGADIAIKPLVELANSVGEDIDYSYFTRVRNKKTNPSLVKSEQIVRVLKSIDGYENIELWMFLVPDFFKDKKHLKTKNLSEPHQDSINFTKELLFAMRTMRIIEISEKQYDDILNVAEYLSKKSSGNQSGESAEQDYKKTQNS